jgi:AbrB family looped-hinge helix DNA binding protein
MGTARISSKGQVAIPVALREAIDLRPGAEVSFELAGGAILLRPVPQFEPLTPKQGYGCIPRKGRTASEADIRRAARAAAAAKWRRRGKQR